jgi:hypothetical protein
MVNSLEQLISDQYEKFHEALLSAFPNSLTLKQMIRFKLDENLAELATGDSHSGVVFNLIEWAKSKGKLGKLLKAAYEEAPDNPKLKDFYTKINQTKTATKTSHKLMNPCNFDLDGLIDQCWSKLEGRSGLVGLALSYNPDPFLQYFCERLKHILAKEYIENIDALTLDYRSSVDYTVKAIKRHKTKLEKSDVICPIRLEVSDAHLSEMSEDFWQKISAEFQDKVTHRFILVIVSRECKYFPTNVIQLEPPQFKKVDIHKWFLSVTEEMAWGEQVRNQWKEKMFCVCLNNELLDIRCTYDLLKLTIKILQQRPSQEEFLQQIENMN